MSDELAVTQGVQKGGYCFSRTVNDTEAPTVNLLASGSIMQQALAARGQLLEMGVNVTIWSITSFIELEREALEVTRYNRLHPLEEQREPYLRRLFVDEPGVFVAVTDYMKSLAGRVARWMPQHYEVLGTDGFGLSESRPVLRAHFEVNDEHITYAALSLLYRAGQIDGQVLNAHLSSLEVDTEKTDPRLR